MPIQNLAIATVLQEIADRLEIQGANPFRVRAYRTAARTVQELPQQALEAKLAPGETLAGLPGIGTDLAAKIAEIARTGTCEILTRLRTEMPSAVTELLRVPGLGPKRVKMLWHELDAQTPEQVLHAAQAGRIQSLHGFGNRMERNIEHAVAAHLSKERRVTLSVAGAYAAALTAYLAPLAGVERVEVAGSFRRSLETVGDLDVVVAAADGSAITQSFTRFGEVEEVSAQGRTRASVRLRGGLQVDLRVVPAASFGAALAYFTGSKAHNIGLRRIAQERGLKLNEYGVFRGNRRIAGATEQSVYDALGLRFIAPELREDRGEIEAAREGRLPALIEVSELKGDLHAHTDTTDGRDTLEAMVAAARRLGLQYVAITDHSRRQAMSHGLDPPRLARQVAAIDRLNRQLQGIRVLRGVEVDILDDGTLDLPDSALAHLDVVVAAVHSRFNLSRVRQTARIMKALENPYVTLLAHPTGRLIAERDAYEVDLLQIARKAKANDVCMEINAQPERLDLADTACRMARDEGVLLAIDSDAHTADEFRYLRYGIGQARRGWLTAADVINTRPLAKLLPLLQRRQTSREHSPAHALALG